MLKVLINEEEVVCDKDFIIKEEMLNTPSVILNNVYPKTWETDKDYVSRFYHPQDYSKCKIQDETYIPYEEGTTLKINGSATLNNVDTSKIYEVQELDGDITQNGTPSPSSPVPVEVVSGKQDITVCGKNLIDLQPLGLVVNSSGTVQSSSNYYNAIIDTRNISTIYISGDFTLLNSSTIRVGGFSTYPVLNTSGTRSNFTSNGSMNVSSYNYVMLCFLANTGHTTDEIKNSFQAEKGNQGTSYEAYNGITNEINLNTLELCKIGNYMDYIRKGTGKNLLDFNSRNIGVSISMSVGSTGTLNSSTTSICTWVEMENGASYTFSGDLSSVNSNVVRCLVTNDEVQIGTTCLRVDNFNASNYTYTNSNNYKYLVLVFTGTTTVGSNWQLEKGTSQTIFEPYGFKDKWYLYKTISKYVANNDLTGNGQSSTRIDLLTPALDIQANLSSANLGQMSITNLLTTTPSGTINQGLSGTTSANKIRVQLSKEYASNNNEANTFLKNNNFTIYYVSNNPTATEITDTDLLTQLNGVQLINGLNNVSIISPNLSVPTTLLYNRVNEETIIDLLFCGVIKNSGNISLNPRYPHYSTLQILDFKTFLSEGETLDYVIANKTIIEAIQSVIDTISDYGFVLGNVNILNSTDIIGAYSTEDKTAYDVFNYIADITQSRWTTRVIDENTVAIDFYDPTLLPQGTSIEYNQNWFSQNLIDDMSYSYNAQDYRNKQVMTSSEVYGNINQTQSFVADGYATQFIVELPIARIQSITINGIEKTFATNVEKQIGYTADFYYTIGKNMFESNKNIAVGSVIAINYIPIVKGRQIITNNNEISRIETSTNRKGIVARYENRNDATTNTELRLIGESYIKYKGKPEILLTIKTRKNLWNVGNRVQFNSPLEALSLEYMVKEKDTNYIATIDTIFYTFILTSSFNSESAINYFDNQRSKNNGNIGEGEYIDRDIDFDTEEVSIIFYDTSLTETTIIGDSELQATLSSPLKE